METSQPAIYRYFGSSLSLSQECCSFFVTCETPNKNVGADTQGATAMGQPHEVTPSELVGSILSWYNIFSGEISSYCGELWGPEETPYSAPQKLFQCRPTLPHCPLLSNHDHDACMPRKHLSCDCIECACVSSFVTPHPHPMDCAVKVGFVFYGYMISTIAGSRPPHERAAQGGAARYVLHQLQQIHQTVWA